MQVCGHPHRKRLQAFNLLGTGNRPEEDYLRFGSKPRRFAFAICEQFALRRAQRIFMVSDAMRRHFEGKYRLDLVPKTFVAPCCNEVLHPLSFQVPANTITPFSPMRWTLQIPVYRRNA